MAGLAAWQREPCDLVILDRSLPRLDGIEVCRRIGEKQGKATPILMLTARDRLDDRVRGLRIGADDYLAKPFAFEELVARVQALALAVLADRLDHGETVST